MLSILGIAGFVTVFIMITYCYRMVAKGQKSPKFTGDKDDQSISLVILK